MYIEVTLWKQKYKYTRIFWALTGPKILAGTAPIKVGSARLVLVDLVACFEFLSAAASQQRLYKNLTEKHNSISLDKDFLIFLVDFESLVNPQSAHN